MRNVSEVWLRKYGSMISPFYSQFPYFRFSRRDLSGFCFYYSWGLSPMCFPRDCRPLRVKILNFFKIFTFVFIIGVNISGVPPRGLIFFGEFSPFQWYIVFGGQMTPSYGSMGVVGTCGDFFHFLLIFEFLEVVSPLQTVFLIFLCHSTFEV